MKDSLGRTCDKGVTKEGFPGGGNSVLDKGGTAVPEGGGTTQAPHGGEGDGLQEVPDGGWGWVVVAGCFLIWALLGSASAVFGVLFAEFLGQTHTSSTTTAWIHNLAFMLSCYCTYMLDPLVEEYGWRRVAFTMGAMRGLGVALSAFAPSPYFLFFSYTLLAGIPIDVLYSLSFSVIPHYFSRRRNAANTLMSVGSSVSTLAFPLFVTYLQYHLGYKAAILITAAISLNLCVAAMVLHPVEWHTKSRASSAARNAEKPPAKLKSNVSAVRRSLRRVADIARANLHLIKSPSVVIVSLAASINLLSLTNPSNIT